MINQPFAASDVIVTTGVLHTWVSAPVVTALIFGLAGGFFISIVALRRWKK